MKTLENPVNELRKCLLIELNARLKSSYFTQQQQFVSSLFNYKMYVR